MTRKHFLVREQEKAKVLQLSYEGRALGLLLGVGKKNNSEFRIGLCMYVLSPFEHQADDSLNDQFKQNPLSIIFCYGQGKSPSPKVLKK